jgi:hypothetical protein
MRPEDRVQKAIIDFLAVVAPWVFVFAIPNASRRTANGRPTNAVPGIVPGMPDLGLIYKRRIYFVEVKAGKGRQSQAQRDVAAELAGLLVPQAIAWSVDDVEAALIAWRIPMRGRLSCVG